MGVCASVLPHILASIVWVGRSQTRSPPHCRTAGAGGGSGCLWARAAASISGRRGRLDRAPPCRCAAAGRRRRDPHGGARSRRPRRPEIDAAGLIPFDCTKCGSGGAVRFGAGFVQSGRIPSRLAAYGVGRGRAGTGAAVGGSVFSSDRSEGVLRFYVFTVVFFLPVALLLLRLYGSSPVLGCTLSHVLCTLHVRATPVRRCRYVRFVVCSYCVCTDPSPMMSRVRSARLALWVEVGCPFGR